MLSGPSGRPGCTMTLPVLMTRQFRFKLTVLQFHTEAQLIAIEIVDVEITHAVWVVLRFVSVLASFDFNSWYSASMSVTNMLTAPWPGSRLVSLAAWSFLPPNHIADLRFGVTITFARKGGR